MVLRAIIATVAHVPNGLAMSVKVPTKWTSLDEAAHTFLMCGHAFFFLSVREVILYWKIVIFRGKVALQCGLAVFSTHLQSTHITSKYLQECSYQSAESVFGAARPLKEMRW